jgi:glycosyltransferase involved in cell wall biosynthesis
MVKAVDGAVRTREKPPKVAIEGAGGKKAVPAKTSFVFDLSTSARWSGVAVGIVRVERELARRAVDHLGKQVKFCVYDPHTKLFRLISHKSAMAIVDGRLQLDFTSTAETKRLAALELRIQLRAHLLRRPRMFMLVQRLLGRRKVSLAEILAMRAACGEPSMTWRQIGREALLRQARLYQAVQWLRGRSLSLAQITQIRVEEARQRAEAVPVPRTTVADATIGNVVLNPNTVIISGGLDWEYKDMRAIYALKARSKFRYAAVIYDLIPLKYPHYVVPHYVSLLTDYFGELFWTADVGMCISKKTQEDALDYCAENGLTPPAMSHFPLGGDLPATEVKAELPSELEGKRYAIFVSTIEPRKNHRALYEAWNHGVRNGLIDVESCRLVFVGRPGWNTSELMSEIQINPNTKNSIVVLQGVSDELLGALYRGATFGLFPSHYEGYGLPLAEMLSHGLPCIVSPAGSLPEVGQSLVVYKDPIDILGWAEAMAQFFADSEALAVHRDVIRDRYQPTTWGDAAQMFFDRLATVVQA